MGCIFPLTLAAQSISLDKLLRLQKSTLLNVEDYIETSAWKFKSITTLQEVDSQVFHINIRRFLDSILKQQATYPPRLTIAYKEMAENTKPEGPAWIEYASEADTKINDKTLFTNSLTIKLPKFHLLTAIDLGLKDYCTQDFHLSIRFAFADRDTYKSIINEVDALNIKADASYIMYNEPLITRVYKLPDQVISLTMIDDKVTSYSLEIYSRSDYDYLHAAEEQLKGKSDFIH